MPNILVPQLRKFQNREGVLCPLSTGGVLYVCDSTLGALVHVQESRL